MRQNQKSSEFMNYFMYSNVINTEFVISQCNHSFFSTYFVAVHKPVAPICKESFWL